MPGLSAADRVLLLGAGRMGGALLEGWLKSGLTTTPPIVLDPSPQDDIRRAAKNGRIQLNPGPDKPVTVAVVAVKPQIIEAALAGLRAYLAPDTIVLSIAAGISRARLTALLGARPIVRAMPNTPAAVGKGMTVCSGAGVAARARDICTRLLNTVGDVAWIDDESLMDAVTAVSGSGPAYFFLLVECLAAAGEAQGLSRPLALQLARQTLIGAAALLETGKEDAARLRAGVTSPGGTTEAAMQILMDKDGLKSLLADAVAAATARGKALGRN